MLFITFSILFLLQTFNFILLIFLYIFDEIKCDGFVGIPSDIPYIFAPYVFKNAVNQDPLKPVCPVIIIFFYKKSYLNL